MAALGLRRWLSRLKHRTKKGADGLSPDAERRLKRWCYRPLLEQLEDRVAVGSLLVRPIVPDGYWLGDGLATSSLRTDRADSWGRETIDSRSPQEALSVLAQPVRPAAIAAIAGAAHQSQPFVPTPLTTDASADPGHAPLDANDFTGIDNVFASAVPWGGGGAALPEGMAAAIGGANGGNSAGGPAVTSGTGSAAGTVSASPTPSAGTGSSPLSSGGAPSGAAQPIANVPSAFLGAKAASNPAAAQNAAAVVSSNQQGDPVTIRAATSGQFITLESPGHRIVDVQAFNAPTRSVNLPLGLIGFKVLDVTPGGSATVTMTLPQDDPVSTYYKQDPATGVLTPFNYDGSTGAEIHGNAITLHFVQGGRGDTSRVAGVIDDPGGPGSPTFTWTNASPTPPALTNPGNQTSAEGANVSLQLSGSSPLGYALTYDAVGLPLGLSINQSTGLISGTVDYSDAEAFGGSYSVTAIAADGHGGSASQTSTWTITNVDRAPTITNPGNQSSAQGDAVSLQVSASDPDGDALSYLATGLPAGLSIDSSSGLISGNVDLAAMGSSPYAVTVVVSDGTLSASQTFAWTVTNTNRAPQVTSPGNQSNARGDTVSLQIAGTDTDGDALTYTASGLPPGLSIDPGTGIIAGTVANSAVTTTPYNATVTASDGAQSGSQNFTWSISHLGIVSPGDQTNVNGDAVSLQILANDPDGDTLSYSATGLPPNLSISSSTGLISGTLTNSADAGSPYSTTVTASDGTNTTSQTFNWTVAHLALTNPGNQVTRQGSTVTLQLSAHDSDNDGLTYSASGLPPGISISATTGVLSGTAGYIPNTQSPIRGPLGPGGTVLPIYSPYAVTISASDGVHSASQSFVWSVPPHVVVIDPPAQSNATLDTVNLPVTAKDSDGDILTYSASGLPAGLSINSSTGVISGTISSTADSASPYASTVTVSDGTYSTSQTFTWTVSHVFVVNPGNQANTTGDVVSLSVSARDRDGDTLTYAATGLPSGLSMNSSTGLISGTIANTADAGSPYNAMITASDGSKSNSQTLTWTVTQHIAWLAIADQNNADGDVIALAAQAIDPDGDTVTYSGTGLPPGLGINSSTGLISGTISNSADSGSPYAVTLTASDGSHSGSQSFNWTVTHLGVANPGSQTSNDGAAISLQIQGRDIDHDTLSYSAGLPAGLTINSSTGVISGTISFSGHTSSPYNATVTVSDSTHSASQSFIWIVGHLALSNPGNASNTEGDAVSLQLSGTDTDHDALTYNSTVLPAGLTLNSSTGLISGSIAAGAAASSPYTINVSVTDGTLSSSQSFTWTVNPYVALTAPANQSSLEGASISLQIQASDAGNHALTYSASGLPTGLSISSSGLISGIVATGDSASTPYGVSISATDGTYSSAASFSWTITHSSDQNPTLTNPGNQGNHESDWVALPMVASEPDGDTLTYTASGLPDGLSINPSTGLISGTIADSAAVTGSYNVTVIVTDPSGGSASQTFLWMVNDGVLTAQGVAVSATEGTAVPGATVATFTDPDLVSSASDFSATINWGDGNSRAGTISGSAGSFSVSGTNTYSQPGSYTATITITDAEGSSTSTSSTATVASASLSVTAFTVNAIAGSSFNGMVASFTDNNANDAASSYSATIQWGDSGSSSGTVTGTSGSFLVSANHTYATTGNDTVTVTITDKDGTSANSTATASVGNAFAGATANLTASPFTGVSGGTPSNSSATITWGDGNSGPGVVTGSLGNLTVTGSHAYAQTATYSVSITVTSTTGGSQTASGSVIVVAAGLAVFVTEVNATPGTSFQNLPVGVVTDSNSFDTPSSFTSTIAWNDGSANSSGTISGSNGLYRVLGSHTYPQSGLFPLNVFVNPPGGGPPPGGGGGQGNPGLMSAVTGPGAVPGWSIYRYWVILPHVAGLPNKLGGPPVITSSDPVNATPGPTKIGWIGIVIIGFYADVTFKNVPAAVTLSATFTFNGGPFRAASKTVYLVQVVVKNPIEVHMLTTGGNNIVQRDLGKVFTATNAFRHGTPNDTSDRSISNNTSPTFGSVVTKTVFSGNMHEPPTYYPSPDGKGPGLWWSASVTLNGPTVGGIINVGVDKIRIGFVQHITILIQRGRYANGKQLISPLEGKTFLDMGVNAYGVAPVLRPYYNLIPMAVFFDAKPQPAAFPLPPLNQKIIWSADNPDLGAPLTYDQESLLQALKPGNHIWLNFLTARAHFKLDITAQTTEFQDSFWQEAWVNWEFDATGKITPRLDVDRFDWTPAGAKVSPPPGGKWNLVAAPTPEATTGPIYNLVDKVPFK